MDIDRYMYFSLNFSVISEVSWSRRNQQIAKPNQHSVIIRRFQGNFRKVLGPVPLRKTLIYMYFLVCKLSHQKFGRVEKQTCIASSPTKHNTNAAWITPMKIRLVNKNIEISKTWVGHSLTINTHQQHL